MLGWNSADQLSQFVERQRGGWQVIEVGVIGDNLVGVAPVPGKGDHHYVILGASSLQLAELCAKSGRRGIRVGDQATGIAEVVGERACNAEASRTADARLSMSFEA